MKVLILAFDGMEYNLVKKVEAERSTATTIWETEYTKGMLQRSY